MQQQLKLTYKTPITAFEGLTVRVRHDGSFDLLFHQITDGDDSVVNADVVAAVHLPGESAWQEIQKLVGEQLDQARQREN